MYGNEKISGSNVCSYIEPVAVICSIFFFIKFELQIVTNK